MKLETLTLRLGETSARIIPARGALISSLAVRGRSVLYLDQKTVDDPMVSVRGGIPILFPFAGKLADDRFIQAGTTMAQHGFGRRKTWSVAASSDHALRLRLIDDADTREVFPFNFAAELTALLLPHGLHLELLVCNLGSRDLPLSPGWHPYFPCPAPMKEHVAADLPGLTGRFLADAEVDFGLTAAPDSRVRVTIPGVGQVSLTASPEMRHLQCWSLPGRDFVCIEPFWGPANTLNTEARALVPPRECRTFWMRLEVDPL